MERLIHELTRVLAVLVTAPLWYPVVKSLWQEANKALRRDGGILGPIPDRRALRDIERAERFEEPSLVSEPRQRGRSRQPARSPGRPVAGGRARREAPRRGGFS